MTIQMPMKFKSLFFLLNLFPVLLSAQCTKYIKVLERQKLQPLDWFDVSIYEVVDTNFIFIANSLTDTNGIARFDVCLDRVYKVNANQMRQPFKYWPGVENMKNFTGDTFTIKVDVAIIDRVRIQDVYFAFDKFNIIDFYNSVMDSVISVLSENPKYKVELQGHTDSKGNLQYNLALSEKRANAVKAYMVSKGIDETRILTKALADSTPVAPNEKNGSDDPEGRAQNRRVEFKMIPPDEP